MKSYYKCSLFEEEQGSLRDKKNFSILQEEIVLKDQVGQDRHSFQCVENKYVCSWKKQQDWDSSKPTIIIPIKDNKELLLITIANFVQNNVMKHCNVIVVDDRSVEPLEKAVLDKGLSYLRVDNERGFNFSMLNNIAAKICYDLGVEKILLWNSDLWCVSEEWFLDFLKRHDSGECSVSGSKLLYPPMSMSLNGEVDTQNIINNFPHMTNGKWRETVQYGGDVWFPSQQHIRVAPSHYKRFGKASDLRVNCDRGSSFITGALQQWNLKDFVKLGGLNPSLSKNYQDVDICLRALEEGKQCLYLGKDIYFYHDESPVLTKEGKNDKQMFSDHVLFGKIWNEKIVSLIF